MDCLLREENIPQKKQLGDHSPYCGDQNQQAQKGDPLVNLPPFWCEESQQDDNKKDHHAFCKGEDHCIGSYSDGIPYIRALSQPGNISEDQD